MKRLALVSFVAIAVWGTACASTGKVATASDPLVPDSGQVAPAPEKDMFMTDVKKAVAAQLECGEEEINMICVRRDGQGECVSVRGDGCGRTVEYQFGDV